MSCKLNYGFNYSCLEDDNCQQVVYAFHKWYSSKSRKMEINTYMKYDMYY